MLINSGYILCLGSDILFKTASAYCGSVVGSVIQATGMSEFVDGLIVGVKLVHRRGLQSACTML